MPPTSHDFPSLTASIRIVQLNTLVPRDAATGLALQTPERVAAKIFDEARVILPASTSRALRLTRRRPTTTFSEPSQPLGHEVIRGTAARSSEAEDSSIWPEGVTEDVEFHDVV